MQAVGHIFDRPGRAARSLLAVALLSAGMSGCASNSDGPELLTVPAADYPAAFDAALEAARREGMPAALRDRRAGVIETNPCPAGSLLEPWRTDNASLDQATENTMAYQRRLARFEFAPAGMNPGAQAPATQPLTGPDFVSGGEPPLDLSQAQGDLELRVWVYLERGSIPGLRRSTWTRSKTTQTQLVYPEGQADRIKGKERGMVVNWTPVARDPDYERRLLRMVQEIMANPQPQPAATTAPAGDTNQPPPASTRPLARTTELSPAHGE
jgi:hypothetical protein